MPSPAHANTGNHANEDGRALVSGWSVTVHHHGAADEPVLVVDGFAPDPTLFVEDALFLAFKQMGPHYPGVRAAVAPVMLRDLLARLHPLAAELFGTRAIEVVEAFYSLVTTPPAALAPIQRLPHFDGVEPGRLALLHYLSRDERSGTAFYRHRSTGFERIDAARLPAYRVALEADLARDGMPDSAYIAGDTPVFEQLAVHAGLYNRAILYRSNTLHCAFLPPDLALDADPERGRLTVNTFLADAGG